MFSNGGTKLSSERAREMGRLSGQARRRFTLENIRRELGPLNTVEDAMRRLDLLGQWAAAKLLPGSVAGAAVRSVEVWLKGHEAKLSEELVNSLRRRVEELEAQLRGRAV